MNKIFKIIFIVLLINIFIGLIEITTGWHLKEIPSYYINTWVTNAPFTFFQNINDAATYFVLYLPLSFATLYKVRRSKFLFALVFIVSALIVLSTSSRLNYLVLSIQLVAYFYFLTDKTKYKMLKRLLLSSLVVIFILFIVTNIYILDGGYINNQIINEMASLKGFFSDEAGSLFIRRRLIVESLNVLYESGLLGVGAGNIEFSMRNTNIAELTGTETLHNWWLELIGNYGIVIFVLFIIFYLKILVNLWKIKNRTKSYPLKIYSFSLFVSLLSFSLSSMSSSSIIQLRYIWILFGLGLAVIKLGKEEHKKGVRNENSSYN
jgi:teichuronic acid biosynthesis protein TuaE